MQESYFVICFNLDYRRYAIDQARIHTFYKGGRGGGRREFERTLAISETFITRNLKFLRALKTSFNLVTMVTPESRGILSRKSLDFSQKY